MRTRVVIHVCSAAVLFAARCSVSPVAGGGGEVTNGVCTVAGVPRGGVAVTAYPVEYVPCRSQTPPPATISDNQGAFSLTLPDGSFNLCFLDTLIGLGAFRTGVGKGEDAGIVEIDSLGSVSGAVVRPSTGGTEPVDVYITGSPFCQTLTDDLDFILRRVPPCDSVYTLTILTVAMPPCDSGMVCTEPGDSVSVSLAVEVIKGEAVSMDTVRLE